MNATNINEYGSRAADELNLEDYLKYVETRSQQQLQHVQPSAYTKSVQPKNSNWSEIVLKLLSMKQTIVAKVQIEK